jgi:CRP-like cAMP-binding protein
MLSNIKYLLNNPLFKNISSDLLMSLLDLDQCVLGEYKKGSLVVHEGEACTSIGFIISGTLASQQLTPTGEVLTLKLFQSNDAFGAALYSTKKATYPLTLMALKNSQVLYIPFDQICNILERNQEFNKNFIEFLSSRVMIFKEKVQMLQYKNVRSRLMLYLSNEYNTSRTTTFRLSHTKVAIAEMIGVARPSVSRELKNMEKDQLIKLNGQTITLLKPEIF